jgi:hypothetical protein
MVGGYTVLILEKEGLCLILPPPEQCSRCKEKGSVGIYHNEYHEGDTVESKKIYYEMFYKCMACEYRLETMKAVDLNTWNSYPNDKQIWPKSLQHRFVKGRVR